MPEPSLVRAMYGPGYAQAAAAPYEVAGGKQPERVLALLGALPAGTFVDLGCGSGELVRLAADLGWHAVGIELDSEVVETLSQRLSLDIRSYAEVAAGRGLVADVVHLGDVIEHLTDIDRELAVALHLVRPGGLLVAQGPLEANANLFSLLLRSWGRLRPQRETDLPPWHVLLATARGQRMLFDRFGLEEQQFSVFEVDWPAPSRLSRGDLRRPRRVALFTARKLSAAASRLGPDGWGNRFFYVGRLRRPAAVDLPISRGG